MAKYIENRIAKLEEFRYRTLGRVNAIQTLLFDAWLTLLQNHTDDPVAAAEAMRARWMKRADLPDRQFPDADPAHIDLVGQEHMLALDELTAELIRLAHQAKAAAKK